MSDSAIRFNNSHAIFTHSSSDISSDDDDDDDDPPPLIESSAKVMSLKYPLVIDMGSLLRLLLLLSLSLLLLALLVVWNVIFPSPLDKRMCIALRNVDSLALVVWLVEEEVALLLLLDHPNSWHAASLSLGAS